MKPPRLSPSRWALACLALGLLLVFGTRVAPAAATLSQEIDPQEANVGDEVTVTITVQNGGGADIQMPAVDGLQVAGKSSATNIAFTNGSLSSSVSQIFTLVPIRAGNFTIPAFDIHLQDGQVLHARPMPLKVVASGAPTSNSNASPLPGMGPVIMPPAMPNIPSIANPPGNTADANSAASPDENITPPVESDGRPAKVFMLISPKTTDAYVGETIPMKIEFFIRMDVIAQQDSLPTIKGSNFLINDLSVRPAEDELNLMNEPYHRETWVTALSAPRTGDFPLQMERDTYWTKNSQGVFADPLGNFFGPRPQLAHGNVPSNELTLHVHALPDDGRPADFTGAIGQFKAAGNADPVNVNVGEPVYLDFSVAGEGNFDHVRSPALTPDAAWKSYVPSSKINYTDESHTQGEKVFRQAIIPLKNGVLPLPPSSFSYFDPNQKKYVTIPIELPAVTVTGTPAVATPAPASGTASTASAPAAADAGLAPNRFEFGALRTDLIPAYRQGWFWWIQGGGLLLVLATALLVFFFSRGRQDDAAATRTVRQRSLQELEDEMTDAVSRDDAVTFFSAARRAVQLHWSARWNVPPEAVTLSFITDHDPQWGESIAPLFAQADEVLYSGQYAGTLNLAEWEHRVREEWLQLEPA